MLIQEYFEQLWEMQGLDYAQDVEQALYDEWQDDKIELSEWAQGVGVELTEESVERWVWDMCGE